MLKKKKGGTITLHKIWRHTPVSNPVIEKAKRKHVLPGFMPSHIDEMQEPLSKFIINKEIGTLLVCTFHFPLSCTNLSPLNTLWCNPSIYQKWGNNFSLSSVLDSMFRKTVLSPNNLQKSTLKVNPSIVAIITTCILFTKSFVNIATIPEIAYTRSVSYCVAEVGFILSVWYYGRRNSAVG